MAEEDASRPPNGRLLLFEPDPAKRHYYEKYVRGIIWRRLSEAERQERIAAIVLERRATAHGD